MQKTIKIILVLIICSAFSCCKKKVPEPIVVKQDEKNSNPDFGHIRISAEYFTRNDSVIVNYVSCNATFFKSPVTDLEEFPSITNFTFGNFDMIKSAGNSGNFNFSSIQIASDYSSFYRLTQKPSFRFNSPELGNCVYVETDTVVPKFEFAIKDTLMLSRNSMNSFTINNTPANYQLTMTLNDNVLTLNKTIYPGLSVIKIYPSELEGFRTWFSEFWLEYTQTKKITLNHRSFQFSRHLKYKLPVKSMP